MIRPLTFLETVARHQPASAHDAIEGRIEEEDGGINSATGET